MLLPGSPIYICSAYVTSLCTRPVVAKLKVGGADSEVNTICGDEVEEIIVNKNDPYLLQGWAHLDNKYFSVNPFLFNNTRYLKRFFGGKIIDMEDSVPMEQIASQAPENSSIHSTYSSPLTTSAPLASTSGGHAEEDPSPSSSGDGASVIIASNS